jgi:hypothetical protein
VSALPANDTGWHTQISAHGGDATIASSIRPIRESPLTNPFMDESAVTSAARRWKAE